MEYKGTIFEEMDVDAIIARKPAVVLVDELVLPLSETITLMLVRLTVPVTVWGLAGLVPVPCRRQTSSAQVQGP